MAIRRICVSLWVCCALSLSVCWGVEEPAAGTPNVQVAAGVGKLSLVDAKVVAIRSLAKVVKKEGQIVVSITADKIQVQRRGSSRAEDLGLGGVIHPGDTLITDPNTSAQIQLMDGSLLVLGPKTRVTFQERVRTTRGVRTVLVLYHGLLRAKTSPIAHAGGFTIRTSAAQARTQKPSGWIVRHREPRQVGKRGCTRITLVSGSVLAWGVNAAGNLPQKTAQVLLDEPGEQAHFCDQEDPAAVPPRLDEKALAVLLGQIPFVVHEKPHPGDDVPLPPPVVPSPTFVVSDPGPPDLPGVVVAPPRIVGDDPFHFTPGIPDGLPPVSEISP